MSAHGIPRQFSGAPWDLGDPGTGKALPNDRSGTINIVTGASGETNTLAAPLKAGLELALNFLTDGGGDRVITVASAYDDAGNTTITFATAGQYVLLKSRKYGSTYRWRAIANSTVAGTGAAGNPLVLDSNGDVSMPDMGNIAFGGVFSFSWDTTDANANQGHISLPTGGAVDVPVIVIGQGIDAVDSARYDGVTEPRLAIYAIGATATGPVIETRKSRGTFAAPTVVTSADDCGVWRGFGCVAAGEYVQSCEIKMETTGTIATTRGPGVMTFSTATDAAPSVLTAALTIAANQVVSPLSGFIPKSLQSSSITGATVLTTADSGGCFKVAKTSAYAITLPTPQQGLKFKFMVLDTGANAVTISNGSAHLKGLVSINNVNTAMTGTTLTLASAGSIGDWVEFEGIDATNYIVTGACISAADIAIA